MNMVCSRKLPGRIQGNGGECMVGWLEGAALHGWEAGRDELRRAGPPVFKITPFVQPGDLDDLLDRLGYEIVAPSFVMKRRLDRTPDPEAGRIAVEDELEEHWLDRLASYANLSPGDREATKRLVSGTPSRGSEESSARRYGFATLYDGEIPAGCGIAVLQQQYLGLYDIVIESTHRRQGWGTQLVLHLWKWGTDRGAEQSFLQVAQDNTAAVRLYEKLGYFVAFPCWYRVKRGRLQAESAP